MNLTSGRVVRDLLKRHGLQPSRRRGQSFLVDQPALERVLDAAGLTGDETVLEIGPGLGALTRGLAGRARRVVAVEVDRGLCRALREETVADLRNVVVVEADFLRLDLTTWAPEMLGAGRHPVVSNIPYSITTPIVTRLLEHPDRFDPIVLLVQQEVADRITAARNTRDYGPLTLFVDLKARARQCGRVSRHCFLPEPAVDSAVLRLDVRQEPRFGPEVDEGRYLDVVHAAFRQRRKNLANALGAPPLFWDRPQALAVLAAAGVDPRRRGETLSAEEFALLSGAATGD